MKPIVMYVDDQPQNLTVFEASMPDSWEIVCFDSPIKAIQRLDEVKPWVIISDQRMPGMSGVEFLEITRKILPQSVRIIVTGFSEEELVIQSVRKAHIFDYICKPWEVEDLEIALKTAIDYYVALAEKERLVIELNKKNDELEKKTIELMRVMQDLHQAKSREESMRKELECWVPPFVIWAVQDQQISFPIVKDIVGVTFDIVNSSGMHTVEVQDRSLRSIVLQRFSEAVLHFGGWRESHAGDSAYAHFGLIQQTGNPFDAALAAANEFRVSLRGLHNVHNVTIECGIAIHLARRTKVDLHTVQLNTPRGSVVQKSFDTTSIDIDLLHRLEKLAHELPGSNIILSDDFIGGLSQKPRLAIELGYVLLKGQDRAVKSWLIPSDLVDQGQLQRFISKNFLSSEEYEKSLLSLAS